MPRAHLGAVEAPPWLAPHPGDPSASGCWAVAVQSPCSERPSACLEASQPPSLCRGRHSALGRAVVPVGSDSPEDEDSTCSAAVAGGRWLRRPGRCVWRGLPELGVRTRSAGEAEGGPGSRPGCSLTYVSSSLRGLLHLSWALSVLPNPGPPPLPHQLPTGPPRQGPSLHLRAPRPVSKWSDRRLCIWSPTGLRSRAAGGVESRFSVSLCPAHSGRPGKCPSVHEGAAPSRLLGRCPSGGPACLPPGLEARFSGTQMVFQPSRPAEGSNLGSWGSQWWRICSYL